MNVLSEIRRWTTRSRPSDPGGKPGANPSGQLICDWTDSKLIFTEITAGPNGLTIDTLFHIPRPNSPEEAGKNLPAIFASRGIKTKRVRIAAKGYGVVFRFIQFPKMNPSELKSALTYEAEKYIPFKTNEVIIDYSILDSDVVMTGGGKGMNLLLLAVKNDEIYPILRILQASGLEVELVDVNALAFLNAVEYFYKADFAEGIAALEIGSSLTTLTIAREGKPRFIRDISFGEIDILKRFRLAASSSQDPQASELANLAQLPKPEILNLLKESLKSYITDLKISFNYYLDQSHTAKPIKRLLIGAGGAYNETIAELLKQSLGIEVETIKMTEKVKLGPAVTEEMVRAHAFVFPAAIGLAIRKP